MAFQITVVHPCATTTIANVKKNSDSSDGIQLNGQSVTDGGDLTVTFKEAVVAADTTAGLNICGKKTYRLCTSSDCASGVITGSWATITETSAGSGVYNLVISPRTVSSTPSAAGNVSVYFETKLDGFTSRVNTEGPLTLTVAAPSCDCQKLNWTPVSGSTPTAIVNVSSDSSQKLDHTLVIPTVIAGSKGSSADTPEMRACQAAGTNCAETYTIAMAFVKSDGTDAQSAVSAFTTFKTNSASNIITINPSANT